MKTPISLNEINSTKEFYMLIIVVLSAYFLAEFVFPRKKTFIRIKDRDNPILGILLQSSSVAFFIGLALILIEVPISTVLLVSFLILFEHFTIDLIRVKYESLIRLIKNRINDLAKTENQEEFKRKIVLDKIALRRLAFPKINKWLLKLKLLSEENYTQSDENNIIDEITKTYNSRLKLKSAYVILSQYAESFIVREGKYIQKIHIAWSHVVVQLLHVISILFFLYTFHATSLSLFAQYGLQDFVCSKYSIYLFAYILCSSPASFIVRQILKSIYPDIFKTAIIQINKKRKSLSIDYSDRIIGVIERMVVLTFMLINHYEPIGFLFAAKSIVRYKEDDFSKSRFMLTGTMLSFSISILIGIIAKKYIDILF